MLVRHEFFEMSRLSQHDIHVEEGGLKSLRVLSLLVKRRGQESRREVLSYKLTHFSSTMTIQHCKQVGVLL
jgi:hypothetical protein